MKLPSGVRERAEEFERASLSTWATLACETKGRDRYEDPDAFRTSFAVDRDRLVSTNAYRLLDQRTHAFVAEGGGHGWRTCMNHTTATVSLARAMARALRLNEDLAEAIAAGHALGGPPFGPAGVEALSDVLGYPFDIGEQSLRVVERHEQRLNLTWEVRDGILHQDPARPAATAEGSVAALAGRVASALFELDAAHRGGAVHLDHVPASVRTVLGTCHDARVHTVLADVVEVSTDRPEVDLSPRIREVVADLDDFLERVVRGSDPARAEHDRAVHCMRSLAVFADVNPAAFGTDSGTEALVDRLAAATDADVCRLFTATFRPSGPAAGH